MDNESLYIILTQLRLANLYRAKAANTTVKAKDVKVDVNTLVEGLHCMLTELRLHNLYRAFALNIKQG